MQHQHEVIRARWVVPISTAPIAGGWLRRDRKRILEIGAGNCPYPHRDLGDQAIFPQLVNAHTHLEFSQLSAPIGARGIDLTDWIGLVIASRAEATSRTGAIASGIEQSVRAGVSLIGEITTPPSDYPDQPHLPNVVCFAEVLGLSAERAEARLKAAAAQTERDPWCGLSPHAPYSTTRETIEQCVRISGRSGRPLAMHVAESRAERELLERGEGPFIDALSRLGVDVGSLFPWGADPLNSLIESLARSSRALLIHGNDLRASEIATLSRHHHLSVVYCPRTHAFFGYPPHPVAKMLEAGVRVALGTDSLASNPDLAVWGEVQYLLQHRTDLDPATVVELATVRGADALGYPTFGRIEPGCVSRLGTVATTAISAEQLFRDLAVNDFHPL